MLIEITEWLIDTWIKVWDFLMNGGYIGMLIILLPILRKLASVMKQFVN